MFEMNVACGQPSSAAIICPVWFESSSIACLPMITSCGFSLSMIAFRSFATASGCTSAVPVSTRMPRSAPIAIAVRSVSCDCGTPIDTTTISVTTPASFMRTACSTAISQNGFIVILMFAVSTPLPSDFTRTLT